MPTHDFRAPVLPGTLRISAIADGETYVTDLPAARLESTLSAFEDFVGPDLSADRCATVAVEAGENADAYLVCVAVLWIFLRVPGIRHAMSRERLGSIIQAGGGAMLTVNTATREGDWQFKLYEMPRWPTVVRPSRSTSKDVRRRRQ